MLNRKFNFLGKETNIECIFIKMVAYETEIKSDFFNINNLLNHIFKNLE